MILDIEESMIYLFSVLKIHLIAWELSKMAWSDLFIFIKSYDTLLNVTLVANWGPKPEAILIPERVPLQVKSFSKCGWL